jgi:branched-chain amino acid transport system permease protein
MIAEHLIHGLVIGSLIAFVAVGYALVYSILKFINFAHGEIMALGGYLCYVCIRVFKIESFALAVLLSVLLTGLVGVLIERVAYRPLRSKGKLPMLLSSLGVSIIIQSGLSLYFGSSPLVYGVEDKLINLAGQPFYVREILVVIFLLLVFVAISIALKRSTIGLAVRSISSNSTRAMLLGIPINSIISIVFFIASALAAVAGISVGIENGLTPSLGFQYSIWAFAVAVIAGFGSIRGILVGGIIFGVIINFAIAYVSSLFANSVALGIMTLILLIRPQGIFIYHRRAF